MPGNEADATANSGGTVGGPANLRPFQPGRSGNPRGRPKRDHDLAALARAHTADAIATLVEVMNDRDAPASARVSAASAVLDRGYGKPPQHGSLDVGLSFSDQFEALIRELGHDRARMPAGDGPMS